MKAVCLTPDRGVQLKKVPAPEKAEPGCLIIQIKACAINSGDKAWIRGAFPPGTSPESKYDICGVSGAGTILEVGQGVPSEYCINKNVAMYRSLQKSEHIVGTWCEYAHMHYRHCVLLPDNAVLEYSGSFH